MNKYSKNYLSKKVYSLKKAVNRKYRKYGAKGRDKRIENKMKKYGNKYLFY